MTALHNRRIVELVEAATGMNLWAEWAKVELAGGKTPTGSRRRLADRGVVQLMISGDLNAISAVPEWTAAIQAAGVAVEIKLGNG